jgi:WhiB family redox-sensing transcriptional regulator
MAMADARQLPGPSFDTWAWQLVGACRDQDSELFFHPEGERGSRASSREAAAKAICAGCPVLAECAAHALSVHEPYGVWGGMSERDREEIFVRERRPAAAARAVFASPVAVAVG